MNEPITFEQVKRTCELVVNEWIVGPRGCKELLVRSATKDDLRAAGFVRVPSVEELVDTINLAEEAWCDSPEEAMDCGPYVARAVLRALGVQS